MVRGDRAMVSSGLLSGKVGIVEDIQGDAVTMLVRVTIDRNSVQTVFDTFDIGDRVVFNTYLTGMHNSKGIVVAVTPYSFMNKYNISVRLDDNPEKIRLVPPDAIRKL